MNIRLLFLSLFIIHNLQAMDVETAKALQACSASIAHHVVKLHDSVRYGSMERSMGAGEEIAIRWVRNHANIDINECLDLAVKHDYVSLAKILLDRGASTESTRNDGPMYRALTWQRNHGYNMLRLLLSYKRHTKSSLGELLRYAIELNQQCLPLLLKHGADVNRDTRNAVLPTPLWEALFFNKGYDKAYENKGLKIIETLLQFGADPNTLNNFLQDETPLIYATEGNREDIVKLLSLHGADWQQTNGKGKTALDYAKGNLKKLLSDPLMIAANARHSKRLKTGSGGSVEIVFPDNWDEQISKAQARINARANAIEYSKKLARLKSMAKKQQALLHCPVNKEA